MFLTTLQQVVILFLYMLIGFSLRRAKLLPESAAGIFSKLEFYVFVPALTFQTFAGNFTVSKLTEQPELLLTSVIALAASCLLGTLLGRRIGGTPYEKNICVYSINMPNTGYVGTPLVLALFGSDTLMQMMIFTIPFAVYTYSEGFRLLLDKHGFSPRNFLNPPFLAMFFGAAAGLLKLPLPNAVSQVLSGCSSCMAPVAMILTGCAIAEFRLGEILKNLKIYETVSVRMLLIPALVLCAARLLRLPQETTLILAAVFTMPTGLNTVILPESIGRDCRLGAGMACVSNTLAILTVPLFFSLFL